jgi:hypothetical protein
VRTVVLRLQISFSTIMVSSNLHIHLSHKGLLSWHNELNKMGSQEAKETPAKLCYAIDVPTVTSWKRKDE